MMPASPLDDDDEMEALDPLGRGAAAPPPVIGGGCLARYDPQSLNEDSGVDFTLESDID